MREIINATLLFSFLKWNSPMPHHLMFINSLETLIQFEPIYQLPVHMLPVHLPVLLLVLLLSARFSRLEAGTVLQGNYGPILGP
jgi:hypothetical protein